MTGVRPLLRLILRRDRWLLAVWVIVLGALPVTYVSAITGLFPTATDRHQYYLGTQHSSAELLLLGPVFGDSSGALGAWRSGFTYVLLGLAVLFTVIRHTRTDEEAGRRELLGATVVARGAPLAAAVITGLAGSTLVGLIAALGLLGNHLPAAGAIALGLALASVGWVFTAVGAVVAQLTEGARSARGLAAGVLAVLFVIRGMGDVGGPGNGLSWLSWLSPIGWAQQTRPFAGDRFWVLVLPVAATVVLVVAALALAARRDIGAGVLPTRPGPATAPAGLRSSFALAVRLQRASLVAWTLSLVAFGAVLGGAANGAVEQLNSSAQVAKVLQQLGGAAGVVDAYFAASLGVIALVAAGYGVSAVLRLRAEEESGRAEPVLATSVSRLGWAAGHLVFGLLGPAVAMALTGLVAGLVYGATVGDIGAELGPLVGAALIQVPAMWLVAGIAILLTGVAPRVAWIAWAALAAFVLIALVGPLLSSGQWLLDLSPFSHIPKLPGGVVSATALVWLSVLAVGLTLVGLVTLRRRDLSPQ